MAPIIPDDGLPHTLLIDNFDSFTWNLYQYLCILGAHVTVIRNDAISVDDFADLSIANLIISPGPGHPKTDSGISREAIRYFAGKIPVLGVCMGLECVVDEYGGTIAYAGEIMHGKTSKIRHDGKGIFFNVPQGIPSTRYHSLSASASTVPEVLTVTATTEESGVIMAVRHREYTIEAVQYHPESIMSEQGSALLKNFLELKGGTWAENPSSKVPSYSANGPGIKSISRETSVKSASVLEKIHAQRLKDVQLAKQTPGCTPADLAQYLSLKLAPPLLSVLDRIRDQRPALMAEIKRASPSKGAIAATANAAGQALTYALAGASVISVLTEPTWFKGSLLDMRLARQVVDSLSDRPAILRKDFIVDEYQISEARVHGADTILLIVAILPVHRLRQLYTFSLSLGMEPLVEVNNATEMQTALEVGAKLIGVNNRNLHDFEVDMSTTTRLSELCRGRDVTLCALSGISGPEDVRKYVDQGVGAVLVGESLMRAADPGRFVRTLLGIEVVSTSSAYKGPLVKICGVRDIQTALEAIRAGADMIGLVFAPNSKRKVDIQTATEIALAVRAHRSSSTDSPHHESVEKEKDIKSEPTNIALSEKTWFNFHSTALEDGPLTVGVFQDQPLSEVIEITRTVQLDLVQLHGSEPIEWARRIPVPVIKVMHLPSQETSEQSLNHVPSSGYSHDELIPGYHKYILLDSLRPGSKTSGGSGQQADITMVRSIVEAGEYPEGPGDKSAAAVAHDIEATVRTGSAMPEPSALRDPLSLLRSTRSEEHTERRGANRLPIILAGGLTVQNVREIVASIEPWAVDVSGGVEMNESLAKDPEQIRAFIKAAKGSSASLKT